jgi:nucleoside deoxyribosyltransferase
MNVYLAHPKFTPDQVSFITSFINVLISDADIEEYNLELLDPFEFSPNIEGDRDAKKILGKSILYCNKLLIDKSDLVIAVIDDRDTGVIWEMGYAYAKNIPIITVSNFDYDVNIMLGQCVLAHFTNILKDTTNNLKNLLSLIKATSLLYDIQPRYENY